MTLLKFLESDLENVSKLNQKFSKNFWEKIEGFSIVKAEQNEKNRKKFFLIRKKLD